MIHLNSHHGGLVTKSCLTLAPWTPWTVARQAPPSMGLSRQEYWSGLPFPSPGDLSNPGIEPRSPALQADSLPTELQGKLSRSEARAKTDPKSPSRGLLASHCTGIQEGSRTGPVQGALLWGPPSQWLFWGSWPRLASSPEALCLGGALGVLTTLHSW